MRAPHLHQPQCQGPRIRLVCGSWPTLDGHPNLCTLRLPECFMQHGSRLAGIVTSQQLGWLMRRSSQAPATLPAPIFVDLVEEDDYDADMDAEPTPLASTNVAAVPDDAGAAAVAVPQHITAPAPAPATATPVAANEAIVQQISTSLPAPALGALFAAPVQVLPSNSMDCRLAEVVIFLDALVMIADGAGEFRCQRGGCSSDAGAAEAAAVAA